VQNNNTKKKVRYKVKNWSEYNRSLIKRGNITLWFSDEVAKGWYHSGPKTRGAQKVYSDLAIKTALTIRSVLSLRLRNLQGFMESLVKLMGINITIPDYTTICRRQGKLKSVLYKSTRSKEPLHIIVDSTGLKVFGEGEWKVRRHGYTKHRMWNKLHIAINAENGDIIAQSLTTNSVTDADAGVELLKEIEGVIEVFGGDSGYDQLKIYKECNERGIKPVIAPQKNANIRGGEDSESPWRARDEHVRTIREMGRDEWKNMSGYSLRSLVETTMFRYKMIFGDKPLAHDIDNQRLESKLKCGILNVFSELGRPESYAVVA